MVVKDPPPARSSVVASVGDPGGVARKLRYLLVDDSPVVRLLLRKGLEREGVRLTGIFEADRASSALRVFRKEHPHVVFMDLTLQEAPLRTRGGRPGPPGGEEVARRMMAEDPALRMVVCTGAAMDDPRVRMLVRLGAFYVLLKPVQSAHLRSLLSLLDMELSSAPASPRGDPSRER